MSPVEGPNVILRETGEKSSDGCEQFSGQIVYNPDGSAYILEESDETLLEQIPTQEGTIVERAGKTASQVEEQMVEEVRRILNISSRPVRSHTSLLASCIAQYTVGHTARLRRARQIIQERGLRLALAGSSYDGVGINDTIMSAKHSVIV